MVRKKTSSTKRTSIFAPPGKVMMIERNRLSNSTPQKTPKSSKSFSKSPASAQSKANKSSTGKLQTDAKKRKTNQTLKALREIKRYQATTRLLIPRAPFSRVVREIAQNILGRNDIRFTALSVMALQEAAEMAMVNLLEIANLCCLHAKRVTLTPADIRLTRRAFGLNSALNC